MVNMKKRSENTSSKIQAGNITNRGGSVVISTGNVTNSGNVTNNEAQLFANVYQAIEARAETSPTEKEDLKAEVKEVEAAIKQPDLDENFITRHLRNIGRMAPDILDVVIATIASPAAGLGLVGKKIAEKAKGK